MLDVKDEGRLRKIIKHCVRIEEKISITDKDTFDTSLDIREIVCFNIFQIGELAKGLSTNITNSYNAIAWKQIKGMRDTIGHGYGSINFNIVYIPFKPENH